MGCSSAKKGLWDVSPIDMLEAEMRDRIASYRAELSKITAERDDARKQLALAECPADLIDIVEATWGDNATVLAYLVNEAEGEATLLLRGVGDWQMYERDADGCWEQTGEGTGVKHTSIRLTKAGAEQLDRWHTDDMLPDDDGVQP